MSELTHLRVLTCQEPAKSLTFGELWCHFSEKRFVNSAYLAGQKAV